MPILKKAFLQISLNPEHRDYVRFLWFDDDKEVTSKTIADSEICEYRICRVLFGVTSSPFLLTTTLNEHIEKYENIDPQFVEKFKRSLHVDDLNSGGETIQECYNFYIKAKNRLQQASFNLRKFQSNSKNLEKLINKKDIQKSNLSKVLGLLWEKQNDENYYEGTDYKEKK